MNKYVSFLCILFLLLTLTVNGENTQRGFYQKVWFDKSQIYDSVPNMGATNDDNYIIEADILETKGEVLTTNKADTTKIPVSPAKLRISRTEESEVMPYSFVLYIQLGAFPTQWKAGNTLLLKVTQVETDSTSTFQIPIPKGTKQIISKHPLFIIPYTIQNLDIPEDSDPRSY